MDIDDDLLLTRKDLQYHARTSNQVFTRRFKNVDQSTCWLNSCLQMLINAFDHAELLNETYASDL